jgi:hypothetical protein
MTTVGTRNTFTWTVISTVLESFTWSAHGEMALATLAKGMVEEPTMFTFKETTGIMIAEISNKQ